MMNLWHKLKSGSNSPVSVNVVVQTPKDSKNSYSFSEEGAPHFELGKVHRAPVFYHGDFGFIPRTESDFGEGPLYSFILLSEGTFPGCVIGSRPIGLLEYLEKGRKERVIVSVPVSDDAFEGLSSIFEIPRSTRQEISQFFRLHKKFTGKDIEIVGFEGPETAHKVIKHAEKVYGDKHV